jgi:hypothetical protein
MQARIVYCIVFFPETGITTVSMMIQPRDDGDRERQNSIIYIPSSIGCVTAETKYMIDKYMIDMIARSANQFITRHLTHPTVEF